MRNTLIVTGILLVIGGLGVKTAYNMFYNSPLGTVKKLTDRKEAIEKIIENSPLEIKQPSLKLQ